MNKRPLPRYDRSTLKLEKLDQLKVHAIVTTDLRESVDKSISCKL